MSKKITKSKSKARIKKTAKPPSGKMLHCTKRSRSEIEQAAQVGDHTFRRAQRNLVAIASRLDVNWTAINVWVNLRDLSEGYLEILPSHITIENHIK